MARQFSAKLKVSGSESINKIFIKKENVVIKKSAKGWNFAEVTVGENIVLVDMKFVHEVKNDSYAVGIKDNFKYQLKDVKATVKGEDLVAYHYNVLAEIKAKKEEAEAEAAKTTETTTETETDTDTDTSAPKTKKAKK